jgi:hypothetical protein
VSLRVFAWWNQIPVRFHVQFSGHLVVKSALSDPLVDLLAMLLAQLLQVRNMLLYILQVLGNIFRDPGEGKVTFLQLGIQLLQELLKHSLLVVQV